MSLLSVLKQTADSAAIKADQKTRAFIEAVMAVLGDSAIVDAQEISLTAAPAAAVRLTGGLVELTGAPASDRNLEILALEPGAKSTVINKTTTAKVITIEDTTGKVIYFAPGQSRTLTGRADGSAAVENPDEFSCVVVVSLVGAVADNDTDIASFPIGTVIDKYSVLGLASKVGGTSTLSLGANPNADDILVDSTTPATAGGIIGPAAADWGTLVDADSGQVNLAPGGGTVTLRNAVTVAPVTAGVVAVQLSGRIINANLP